MAALEQSWSVTVRIESYPFETGSLTIKSRAMVWKGNTSCTGVIGIVALFVPVC
jgi:hypothetical protein